MLTACDAYLVSVLNTMDKKLHTIMRIVSTAPPELPDDVSLPVNSEIGSGEVAC